MEVRVRVPEKQKKAVRTIMKELFNVLPTAEDEDTMMSEFRRYCERPSPPSTVWSPSISFTPTPAGRSLLRAKS